MERIAERSDRITHIVFGLLIIVVFLAVVYLTRRKNSNLDTTVFLENWTFGKNLIPFPRQQSDGRDFC